MKQPRFVAPILLALGPAVLFAACSGAGSPGGVVPSGIAPSAQMQLQQSGVVREQTYQAITISGHPEWVLRLGYVPAPNGRSLLSPDGTCSEPQLSLPNWIGSFKDAGSTYCYQMIGANPMKAAPPRTTLTTQIYAYKLKFSNGVVFDPMAINKKCDSVSPYTRFVDSPLYHAVPIVNGKVSLGTIQYEDAQSVGEWYKFVKGAKGYGVDLKDTGKPVVITLSVPPTDGSTRRVTGFCSGSYGVVDLNWLASKISTRTWSVKQLSVVLLWNVVQTVGTSCCVGGYHSYFQDRQGQNGVAGVMTISNAGLFSAKGLQDISIPAHEFGEAINDPFADNVVPAWGHTGQQPNCQNNLEVGDPLTGTVYGGSGIKLKGFTYHPQELVYFNWFTQQTKYADYGADDVYSMSGTFTSPAQLCTGA